MKLVWEEVEYGMNRTPVPGGWIVQQYDQRYNESSGRWDWQMVGAFFVPDETHAWDITANNKNRGACHEVPCMSNKLDEEEQAEETNDDD